MSKIMTNDLIQQDNNYNLSHKFFIICKAIYNARNSEENYIDISSLIYLFNIKHPNFNTFHQNDTIEFCRILLEDFSIELNEVKCKPLYQNLTYDSNISKKNLIDLFIKEQNLHDKSIITELFNINMINKFICKCNKVTYAFNTIKDIPLLITTKKESIKLEYLIEEYFKREVVEYEYECVFCNKVCPHVKITKILNLPQILVFSLQRFNPESGEKNEAIINFDTSLTLESYLDESIKNNVKFNYNLFGVINHDGNLNYGHYFSYIKFYQKDEWFEFNDRIVESKGTNIRFDYKKAYILFYQKRA